METRLSKFYPQKWVQIALLIAFCFILYFLNLNQWDLWNPDEPRYAQVAREMVNSGDWILMHYNGNIYPDKPPLFFWLIALSSYLWQGFSSFSVRFPAAFFGTLTVLVTFFLGKTLYSQRTGFISGFILATSFDFAYLSTRVNIDTTLTFFTTASLLCFFLWYRYWKEEKSFLKPIQRLIIYGFYVGMALATLAKGPVGFILPLSVSLIFLVFQKDWKGIKEMRLFTGMILLILVILFWYLPALLRGGEDYLNATLFKHTIDRYAKGWSKARPIYYYLYNFPVDFFPWIFLLPAAVVYGSSKEKTDKRREFLFISIWFCMIFLFFSLSKGKRGLYLLPLYPAASIMVGKFWDDFISTPMERFRSEWISFPLYGFMGLALIAGAAFPWIISLKFPSYLPYTLPIAFLLIGGSLAIFVSYRFKNYGTILLLLIGMMGGGYFYTLRVIFPLVNQYKSARFMSQEIISRMQSDEKLAVYGKIGAAPFNYYTGIVPILELNGPRDLIAFLRSSGRVFCLLEFEDLSQLQKMENRPEVQLISIRTAGNKDIALITNR